MFYGLTPLLLLLTYFYALYAYLYFKELIAITTCVSDETVYMDIPN